MNVILINFLQMSKKKLNLKLKNLIGFSSSSLRLVKGQKFESIKFEKGGNKVRSDKEFEI